jgi:hypothetical protein
MVGRITATKRTRRPAGRHKQVADLILDDYVALAAKMAQKLQ